MINSMKKKSISKWAKIIISAVITALVGTAITVIINMNNFNGDNNTNINGNVDNSTVINGNIYNNTVYADDNFIEESYERERPYTVRETYLSERSGDDGNDYKLVSVDTRMGPDMKLYTYYTYDVTYY